MQVQAKEVGYYNHKRQKEGSVFFLQNEKDYSQKWMKKLGAKEDESEETAEERFEERSEAIAERITTGQIPAKKTGRKAKAE